MVATFRIDKSLAGKDRPANTSNYVNVSKLAAVVDQKIKNSELADSSMRFVESCGCVSKISMINARVRVP